MNKLFGIGLAVAVVAAVCLVVRRSDAGGGAKNHSHFWPTVFGR